MKTQHSYDLIGFTKEGKKARVSTEVLVFKGHKGYFRVMTGYDNACMISTPKGVYSLQFKNGRYEGVCNGFKVHVCLKKIVGTVHTWF